MPSADLPSSSAPRWNVEFLSPDNIPQDPAVLQNQLGQVCNKIAEARFPSVAAELGDAVDYSVVAVQESALSNWLRTVQERCGVRLTFPTGEVYRLVNKRLLNASLEDFSSTELQNVHRLLPNSFASPAESVPLDAEERRRLAREGVVEIDGTTRNTLARYLVDLAQSSASAAVFKDAIRCFQVTDIPGIVFVNFEAFETTLLSFDTDANFYGTRVIFFRGFNISYIILGVRSSSPLLAEYLAMTPSQPTAQRENLSLASAITAARAFNLQFNDKPAIVQSFLHYLSRHYKISTFLGADGNPGVDYYSPLACIHQSSGSGKSRLSSEVSHFVLPIVLSCPNRTGLPKESPDFAKFCRFLLGLEKPHYSLLMTLTHHFLLRIVYLGLEDALLKLECELLPEGTINRLNTTKTELLFKTAIYPDISRIDILYGFKTLLLNTAQDELKESIFKTLESRPFNLLSFLTMVIYPSRR